MSKKQALTDSITLVESPEKFTDVVCESKECYSRKKKQVSSTKSVEKIKENIKEMTRVHEVHKVEFQKDIKDIKSSEISIEIPQVTKLHENHKTKSTKDIKDDQLDISSKVSEETSSVKNIKLTEDTNKTKKIPVIKQVEKLYKSWNAAVPRTWASMSAPNLNEHPLVLATHLVPSLPIGLFEVLAEIIEVVTKKPVILLYEPRIGRPTDKNITDIAILPAAENWKDGMLLPVSLIFKHHLNKNNSPYVYADVIVANDRAPHVEDIMDLRGHRCAVPDRRNQVSAAGLLFNHLHTKGENPAFFGNTLDASSQLAVLQMVAGKQAEVGILEAPVIRCHKFAVPGAEFLHILTSLGPLPPYRIMINKTLVDNFSKELATYLLSINKYKEWMDRLSPFDVIGFAENSIDYYNLHDMKPLITSVPYY